MKQTLTEDLIAKMKVAAEQARLRIDAEHLAWLNNGGIFEAIKYPELAKLPSERTYDEMRTIILRTIANGGEEE